MDKLTLWLAGDVMTGRGIDQIQAHAVAPVLYESWVHDARDYVRLAERVSGPVPAPVAPDYIWGDALAEIERRQPALRIVNLETAITTASAPWPGKGIHYRMHPANIGCLTAARIDCCVLANNHVLDWGQAGLTQTLHTLQQAGIHTAGAGSHLEAACTPAVWPLGESARLLVFSWAAPDSGGPSDWAAKPGSAADSAGVALLPAWDDASAQQITAQVARQRQAGDLVVVSLHWGGNWGVEVPRPHRRFARRLIDLSAADVIHGHSSHHPRPVEVYRGRLILYGCGDLINDYEGISSRERFDASAVCLYFVQLSRETGALLQLDIVPLQLRRLQLRHADAAARHRLQSLLEAEGRKSGTGVQLQADGSWQWRWQSPG
ncbi:MAG: CapA family protein [Polaromonas sp.]|uniref:CapA family protein n=1 Tax=Polaromonas sp. TaxID=1869339 RepID=UPI002733BC45|nr:CapA family protein [Polaromonas sp.]MDP3796040.1 CapA family protein [Polaromonas sp.]